MQSAPAHIPATTVVSFGAGLAAPDLIRGSVMRTLAANSCANPVWAANVITGTSPAQVQLTPGEYVVRAVDQAGNEDANDRRVRLAPSCPASSGGDGSAGGGCTVAPGGRTTTGFFAGVLLGIVVVGLVWARRRGVWRSG